MTKRAKAPDTADEINHGSPISLRLPHKYDELTRHLAKEDGRPLTNFVRRSFIQWLEHAHGEAARRVAGKVGQK